jgi:hypothetical protein
VGSKAGLDVGDGHPSREPGECRTHRARRVSLDDKQIGRSRKARQQRGRHGADMAVRILLAGTFQPLGRIAIQPEVHRIERRMLAGDDQSRRQPAFGEGMRQRRQLDCFRPGPDDQPDMDAIQASP